ncbi:oxygen-independent coproporphyrinogen-3 oxidase [Streptomyces sp. Amel2xB2]|uniref:radical SAM protein n=1 Tax=Streptomyces sp. Amel2xB2 TaxID=1305829 RepID=UPI000DB8FAF0|nr:radical SAM protein [Streptomyces sp. Amel2xB2]RAJ68869.1 oxygen-independent coproporphyrinogen-3 oxidase [Streptomyces sp. Amel2xB2]
MDIATRQSHEPTYEESLASLRRTDPGHPVPSVVDKLAAPENRHLLEYVTEDPFGAHVFPGNIPGYSPADFLADLDAQLASTAPIHLWSYIPTCAYRCRFCQYPVVLVKGSPEVADRKANQWVDWNIREARLWLREVPNLASAPVGEFNVFGGTPSLLPPDAIRRLLDFYREHFNFTPDTAIRFEGDPSTFTPEKLELLAELGCTKLSSGVQSFDDPVLEQCGREHTAQECVDFVRNAQRTGFEWISVDLMYGLLDQTLDSVRRDLEIVLENEVTAVVCTKLHLASYSDTRTGVAGVQPAAWQLPDYRARLVEHGHRWPPLGEQYQMREVLTEGLLQGGYREQPTMYFAREGLGPEKWKAIMVDQDKQEAEVAIGLGGSSSCRASEAITDVNWKTYSEAVEAGRVPLGSATRFDAQAQEARAVKMALSTLQPLSEELHRRRFPGASLFAEPWASRFGSLAERGLAVVDRDAQEIRLTRDGKVLVEAVMNSEF